MYEYLLLGAAATKFIKKNCNIKKTADVVTDDSSDETEVITKKKKYYSSEEGSGEVEYIKKKKYYDSGETMEIIDSSEEIIVPSKKCKCSCKH